METYKAVHLFENCGGKVHFQGTERKRLDKIILHRKIYRFTPDSIEGGGGEDHTLRRKI